jgi:hypothetical protein
VHSFEIRAVGGKWLEGRDRLTEIGVPYTLQHGVEALRSLRMARAGEMFEVNRMGGEQHGHTVGRYLAVAKSELPFPP